MQRVIRGMSEFDLPSLMLVSSILLMPVEGLAQPAPPSVPKPETPPAATAEQHQEARQHAAALYEEGADQYARARYADAATAFLEADALVPNSEALSSAIAAARRGQAHLLVAQASKRAIARQVDDPDLAARARIALAEAEANLSRLSVTCTPAPCVVTLDDQALDGPMVHVLPGLHELSAHSTLAGQHAAPVTPRQFMSEPGVEYQFELDVGEPEPSLHGLERAASELDPEPTRAANFSDTQGKDAAPSYARVVPPWAFYTGIGVTATLSALTVWSGLDALSAKDKLPDRRATGYAEARADVQGAVTRSDWLLGASLLLGAATASAGIWWVDWNSGEELSVGSAPCPGGATLYVAGGFD